MKVYTLQHGHYNYYTTCMHACALGLDKLIMFYSPKSQPINSSLVYPLFQFHSEKTIIMLYCR